MKKLLLTIIAALTLSMSSTYAFRDATTPKYAEDFRALDPMPTHYKTCLAPIDVKATPKPMVVESNTTELMQPIKTWGAYVTNSRAWQWGKWAINLPATAIAWPTTKFLTWTFKAPYVKELLGPQSAAFFGSLVGLTTFYAFSPLVLPTQMIATLQLLLAANFSVETFEHLCSIVTAMLNHKWKNAAIEFAASVIIGLLIFDVRDIRTTLCNGMVNGASAAKQHILNPVLNKLTQLSASAAERANAIADKLCSLFGYVKTATPISTISSKEIGNCMTQSGLGYEQCLQATTNANAQCPALVIPSTTITKHCTLTTNPTSKEIGNCMTQSSLNYKQCLHTATNANVQCPALQKPSITKTERCTLTTGQPTSNCKQAEWVLPQDKEVRTSVEPTSGYWNRFKTLFGGSSNRVSSATTPSTFVHDVNECVKYSTPAGHACTNDINTCTENANKIVRDCADMASTVNLNAELDATLRVIDKVLKTNVQPTA